MRHRVKPLTDVHVEGTDVKGSSRADLFSLKEGFVNVDAVKALVVKGILQR